MHSVLPFLSVLIGFHVIHPNTSVSPVNEQIFDCNNRDANRAFVTFRENTASVTTTGLGLLNAKFTFKGTSPANHFCTDS